MAGILNSRIVQLLLLVQGPCIIRLQTRPSLLLCMSARGYLSLDNKKTQSYQYVVWWARKGNLAQSRVYCHTMFWSSSGTPALWGPREFCELSVGRWVVQKALDRELPLMVRPQATSTQSIRRQWTPANQSMVNSKPHHLVGWRSDHHHSPSRVTKYPMDTHCTIFAPVFECVRVS
jgi:hypothetical protein